MSTTLRITQDDIDNIARKLDDFAQVLSQRERTVFLAVLQLAGKEIKETLQQLKSTTVSPSPLPPLSAGFRGAFQPGVGAKLVYDETAESEGSGTIKIKW
jgi:hypothetical protein